MNRLTAVLSSAALAMLVAGCSVTIGTSPNAYPFPSEEVFGVRSGVTVSVTNFYTAPERVELASRVFCDLQHFTATAVTMVQRELQDKGVTMSSDAEKTIVLKMVYPNWVRGMWSMIGRITLQATLGNGEEITIDAENKTAGNAPRAFNGAILRVVTALLKNETLAAYLNE
jgi:hypothetical protein